MDIEEKESLALTRDMTLKAAAIRIKAARLLTGLRAEQLAQDVGGGMTKQKVSNSENGANFPSYQHMLYFHRTHGIDFNFLMHGDFTQYPPDRQAKLFEALAEAHTDWDQKQSSGRAAKKSQP